MKNLYKGILSALLVVITLVGCEEFQAPDDIESKAGDFEQRSNEIIAAEGKLEISSEYGLVPESSIVDAQGSSFAEVKKAGDLAGSYLPVLEDVIYYSRIASNAVVTTEAIEGTNVGEAEVRVYSYTIDRLENGAVVTDYVKYQISNTDTTFVHHVFAGAAENPTDLVIEAVVNIEGNSADVATNFGEAFNYSYSRDENSVSTYTSTTDKNILVYVPHTDGSFTYEEQNVAGELTLSLTWSDAGYGVKDGEFFHPEYEVLTFATEIAQAEALYADLPNSPNDLEVHHPGDAVKSRIIDELTVVENLMAIGEDYSVTTAENGNFLEIIITWTEVEGEVETARELKFYWDDDYRYYESATDGVNDYYVAYPKVGSDWNIIGKNNTPTTDEFWPNASILNKTVAGDGAVSYYGEQHIDNTWIGAAMGDFITLDIAADNSGEILYVTAPKAYWDGNGTTNWGNSFWSEADWTASVATGTWRGKKHRVFGAVYNNGTW